MRTSWKIAHISSLIAENSKISLVWVLLFNGHTRLMTSRVQKGDKMWGSLICKRRCLGTNVLLIAIWCQHELLFLWLVWCSSDPVLFNQMQTAMLDKAANHIGWARKVHKIRVKILFRFFMHIYLKKVSSSAFGVARSFLRTVLDFMSINKYLNIN